MDFVLDDDLVAARDLATRVFAAKAGLDRVVEVEKADGFDADLWRSLGESGLLGLALPEAAGGADMGMLGLVTLLEAQGRAVAPVPLWAVLAGAALPISRFGSVEQVERLLPGVISGESVIVGALDAFEGTPIAVEAVRKGDDLVLSGDLAFVPGATHADHVLVPVRTDDGAIAVAVVDTAADGVAVTPLATTDRNAAGAVALRDVTVPAADVLPGDGTAIVAWARLCSQLAIAAVQLGVCEEALARTAEYTSQREQFGRPLSTNQAVATRAADAYLDTEALRLTTQHAAWLFDTGRDDEAHSAVLVAKWWAAHGGLRVVLATQHLHGGIGADVDYPIHRFFVWGRQLATVLGSAGAVRAELGDVLAAAPRIGAPA